MANRAHTDEELEKIFAECVKHIEKKPNYIPAYALIFTILTTCRRSEMTCVKWCDIEDGFLVFQRVQLEPARGKGKTILDTDLKSRSEGTTRPIAITEELAEFFTTISPIR